MPEFLFGECHLYQSTINAADKDDEDPNFLMCCGAIHDLMRRDFGSEHGVNLHLVFKTGDAIDMPDQEQSLKAPKVEGDNWVSRQVGSAEVVDFLGHGGVPLLDQVSRNAINNLQSRFVATPIYKHCPLNGNSEA